MNTATKIILGIGAAAGIYFLWKKTASAATGAGGISKAKIGGQIYDFIPIEPGSPYVPAAAVGIISVNGMQVLVDENGREVKE